jgi:hypothetical protein
MPRPPRITAPAPREGSRKLLAHVREHYSSIPAFAEAHGLERQKVERAIDGRLQRVDVDFAAAIQAATKGTIEIADWTTDPSEPADPARVDTIPGFGNSGPSEVLPDPDPSHPGAAE